MRAYLLSLSFLGVVAASLSTALEPWFQNWSGNRTSSDNLLQVALGDSRKLFARHFFSKADAYLHKGYYPTIFDAAGSPGQPSPGNAFPANRDSQKCEGDFLGQPRDWIDRFSRHFFPSQHSHLEPAGGKGHDHAHVHDGKCDHKDHHEDEDSSGESAGNEQEILPWLRFSAALDPTRIETYVMGAYWLRSKLGKVDQAEAFLREGLQENPGNCEILLELGRVYYDRKEIGRARNVLEFSLRGFRQRARVQPAGAESDGDRFLHAQILNQLALLEREQNNRGPAIAYYTDLKQISPNKAYIEAWIEWLQTNAAPTAIKESLP